jgi:ketosteroid isomerase-like protein
MSQTANSIFVPNDANIKTRELIGEILVSRAQPKKFIEYLHEDCVCHVIGARHDYPFGGEYRGREQILGLLHRIDAEVELTEHRILNIVVDNDNVALKRETLVRHHGTAAVAKLTVANLLRLRDGKIADAYEYIDTGWLRRLSGDED